jgi:hypothetical protein
MAGLKRTLGVQDVDDLAVWGLASEKLPGCAHGHENLLGTHGRRHTRLLNAHQ